jgi:hypothetical protein
VRVGHGGRAAVGVRVVGDDQVDAPVGGERHGQVHRTRLLRVGERHGREVRVRVLLLRDDVRRVEAGRLQHLDDGGPADAVQGCVHQAQVAWPVSGELGDGVEVGVDDAVAEDRPAVPARHVRQRSHRLDVCGDLPVGRGHDLAAVAEIDLVPVVTRGVVARGHHHPGRAAQLPDGERELRCR